MQYSMFDSTALKAADWRWSIADAFAAERERERERVAR